MYIQQGKVHKALKHMVNDNIINNSNDVEVRAIKKQDSHRIGK